MGSVTYDFLSNSILFNERSINSQFNNESEERLLKELEAYRKFCIDNYQSLIDEISYDSSFLKVFTSIADTPISLLKQTALYIHQFIIPDPIFKLTEPKNQSSEVSSKYLGYQSSSLDKSQLASSCEYLKHITPMVAGNFVKLFPLSYFFERPTIPIYFPTDQFESALPPEILQYFRENVIVTSLEKLKNGGWGFSKRKLYPCRGISVEFKESSVYSGMVYHLVQSEVIKIDESSQTITWKSTLPDTPPEQEEFENWVNQSINSASRNLFNEIFQENIIASNLNATYLCDNIFTSNLISKHFDVKETIENFTTNQMVNIDVPFLESIDIDKLMMIRECDADTFTNFRMELEKQFRELRLITDGSTLKAKSENIMHELGKVQVEKISQKLKHIRNQLKLNSMVALGGLMGSFHTNGISLGATAVAIGKGYKEYRDYQEKVQENPAYLLWKIKR